MAVTLITSENQAHGAFDAGRIREKKPIGFPQDYGQTKPYSTLFYWAHAWSDAGGFIAEHPHRGFEIMSVVLTGEIEHYDSAHKGWKKLASGDVQVIHSGSGISHAEKIKEKSSIFQIWFDPDLNKALGKPASYKDYESASFPVFEDDDSKAKIIVGGTQLTMDAEIDYIQEITFKVPEKKYPLKNESVYSLFLLEGKLSLNGKFMERNDFAIVSDEPSLDLSSIEKNSRIFLIKSPVRPSYKTYAEMSGQ